MNAKRKKNRFFGSNTKKNHSFINQKLTGYQFQNIDGLTCFAGANLEGAQFLGKIGKHVLFIGSNINELASIPSGGIKTVNDLKQALLNNQFEEKEALNAYDILKNAFNEVQKTIKTRQRARISSHYHINENHLDHLSLAVTEIKTYLIQKGLIDDDIPSQQNNTLTQRIKKFS